MKSAGIREKFLAFFEERGHARVQSSSLVPAKDPTLLFTNSGMAQFKDVFLGFEKRDYKTACTAQRCLRAGGKHNDLENVGHTARHHTFFEMLGNFSFGDYFKERAIPMAWEFLTSPQHMGLHKEHLWVTVFGGGELFGDGKAIPADEDAARLWMQTLTAAGFSEAQAQKRITRVPTSDNFWMMGDAGPCGPCSEIFYDIDKNAETFRGEDEKHADECVEIWNLVFMQFNRGDDGDLAPLPAPCVDTGMGLERISAVMQGVASNFEIDLFAALMKSVGDAVGDAGGKGKPADTASHRVIADHIRAAAYLIGDGVLPSNEGRGYVLRRIIRRALRHGWHLGARKPFFHKLASPLALVMQDSFLSGCQSKAAQVLHREEEGFSRMLAAGMTLLDKECAKISKGGKLPGEAAFKLFDTYGFPLDMTEDVLRGSGATIDRDGFDKCMQTQRDRSRAAMKFKSGKSAPQYDGAATEFTGYDDLSGAASVCAIFANGKSADKVSPGEEALIILDRTPFYAESGGQIGDAGSMQVAGGAGRADVSDTQKIRADVWAHVAKVRGGEIKVGDEVNCQVNAERREKCARNHSAAHLMHAALRKVLGTHVEQRGSLVADGYLRFDFSHDSAVSAQELRDIETLVNERVRDNCETTIEQLPFDEAVGRGAMALFGEKYGDIVRTVIMDPAYSVELCGGTHVKRAGDIGYFCFTGESAIAAGVRRVEALAGGEAVLRAQQQTESLLRAAATLKTPVDKLTSKAEQLQDALKAAQKQLSQLRDMQTQTTAAQLVAKAEDGNGCRVVIEVLEDADGATLRDIAMRVRGELSPAAVLLAGKSNNKAGFAAAVDKTSGINAREWLTFASEAAGAKGGGKDEFAQAGGGDIDKIPAALQKARDFLRR